MRSIVERILIPLRESPGLRTTLAGLLVGWVAYHGHWDSDRVTMTTGIVASVLAGLLCPTGAKQPDSSGGK